MSCTSNEKSNVNENDYECIRKSSRVRTMTEKGRSYHESIVRKAGKEQARKLTNALSTGRSKSCTNEPAQNEPEAIATISKNGDSMTFVGQDTKSLSEKVNPMSCEHTFNTAVKQLQNQLASIDHALDTKNVNLVKDESRKLDQILPDVMDASSKLLETMDVQQMSKQSELVNSIETNAMQKKHDIYE